MTLLSFAYSISPTIYEACFAYTDNTAQCVQQTVTPNSCTVIPSKQFSFLFVNSTLQICQGLACKYNCTVLMRASSMNAAVCTVYHAIQVSVVELLPTSTDVPRLNGQWCVNKVATVISKYSVVDSFFNRDFFITGEFNFTVIIIAFIFIFSVSVCTYINK